MITGLLVSGSRSMFGIFLWCSLLIPFSVQSQNLGLHEWARSLDLNKIVVEVNWDSLMINKNSDKEWSSTVRFITSASDTMKIKAKISVRGKYRRRICDIPPMEIDFRKKSLRKLGLNDDMDEYKLVTHCQDNYKRLELVEVEAMIYRMYEQVTPKSFRSIEINAEYRDRSGTLITEGRAIFLESSKEFAARTGSKNVDGFGMNDSIAKADRTRLALFQCMIANHDWDINMLKNVRLFRTATGEVFAVPYDFDFSGWVNAPYWVARSDLKLVDSRDRYLFLDAVENSILETQWEVFDDNAKDLKRIINENPELKKSKKRLLNRELDAFLDLLPRIRKGERRFLVNG